MRAVLIHKADGPGAFTVGERDVPDDLDPASASTLPMNGLTALEGLHVLGLPPGATLAVTGGAGVRRVSVGNALLNTQRHPRTSRHQLLNQDPKPAR